MLTIITFTLIGLLFGLIFDIKDNLHLYSRGRDSETNFGGSALGAFIGLLIGLLLSLLMSFWLPSYKIDTKYKIDYIKTTENGAEVEKIYIDENEVGQRYIRILVTDEKGERHQKLLRVSGSSELNIRAYNDSKDSTTWVEFHSEKVKKEYLKFQIIDGSDYDPFEDFDRAEIHY